MFRSRWTRSASRTSASWSPSAASSARRTRRENGWWLIFFLKSSIWSTIISGTWETRPHSKTFERERTVLSCLRFIFSNLSNWDVELLLELSLCVAGGNERSREQVRLDFQGRGHLHSDHQEPHCWWGGNIQCEWTFSNLSLFCRSQYFQSEKSKTFLRLFGDMHGFHPALIVFDNHDIAFDFSSHNIWVILFSWILLTESMCFSWLCGSWTIWRLAVTSLSKVRRDSTGLKRVRVGAWQNDEVEFDEEEMLVPCQLLVWPAPSPLGPKFYLEKHNLHDPMAPNFTLKRVDRQDGKIVDMWHRFW